MSSGGTMGIGGATGMGGGMGGSGTGEASYTGAAESVQTRNSSVAVVPVTQVQGRTVSALIPEMSDEEFVEAYTQERNMGFLSAVDKAMAGMKNTVLACIHTDQTVMDGQSVRLRLLESIQVGNIIIPSNTILSGTAKIVGERMAITVNLLEHGGRIIPVDLRAYDTDGQNGIFIPNLQELSAAKEILANMGTSAGTSINLSDEAGKQFVADMGRNVIQGVSQFAAKKLREVKVHLKAGYRVYLLTDVTLKATNK